MLPISNEEIEFSESVLLPPGRHFDDERRTFIRELRTCDLQAVPGSGKTTALLAKLLILEKRLPLLDGAGILVLSHTNTAVDEIKAKLHGSCTKLLSFPNFIGTIQSFVDEFLAIPYYLHKFGYNPVRIDNEIYDEKVMRYRLPYGANAWVNNRGDSEGFRKGIRLNAEGLLVSGMAGTTAQFPLVNRDSATYQALLNMKMKLLEDGYLHFDDAYYLASKYLHEIPKVISFLRRRFSIVFVDEMQDMEPHQYSLLEQLFYTEEGGPSYQRIGDRNQSIYGGIGAQETNWVPRANLLHLAGSHRLSPQVASVVRPFGIFSDTQIDGLNDAVLPPHLFLFNQGNHERVLPTFAGLIKQYQADGVFPQQFKYPIKAIGWVAKPAEGENLFVSHYFPQYRKESKIVKIDHSNFFSYLVFYDKKKTTFSGIRASILNAFLRILRLENITYGNRDYAKKRFVAELKATNKSLYDEFSLNLYKWCLYALQGHIHLCHSLLSEYLPGFIQRWKGLENLTQASLDFLNSTVVEGFEDVDDIPRNVYLHEDLQIEVDTVHSVKGQTHTATLYMETFYYSYESDKCIDQLLGTSGTTIQAPRKKEASKILYVGLSRPTHLLCLAISRQRLGDREALLEARGWRVIQCQ